MRGRRFNGPNYTSGIDRATGMRPVIWVVDEGGDGQSVTNGAEQVVAEVVEKYGDHPIVYCDSTGRWDELCHNGKDFTTFGFIGARTSGDAIQFVRSR